MKKKTGFVKWAIGGGIIAASLLAMSMLNFGDSIVYFYTPDEALAKASEISPNTIKVGGMVKAGSVQWEPKNLHLAFVVSDLKGTDIAVTHKGTPPDMFKENSGVVVEGKISPNGQTFTAYKLMVKHSEEYKKPDKTHALDKTLIEKSMFKN